MPGIHTIILSHPRRNLFRESDLNFLLHEENFKVKIITNLPNCLMAISFYSGYPFIEWRDNDIQIVLEGMIYNYPMAEIQKQLNEIAKNLLKILSTKI
jgi:hypothetical protein